LKIGTVRHDLALEVPFAISRSVTSTHAIVVAELHHGSFIGYGEASPSAYYGDSPDLAEEAIDGAGRFIGNDPFAILRVSESMAEAYPRSPSGRAAVEMAMFDLAGKMVGEPVFRMLGLSGMRVPRTSLTVGVTDVALAERRLPYLRGFPILKAKVGFGDECGLLDLLKRKTTATLRVDANEGWTLNEALTKIDDYRDEYAIEFFEQPLPKEDMDGYRELARRTGATIILDESISCKEDVLKWSGSASGINIKLMKCGGLLEALRMIGVARAAGMQVMLGCMVESSLAISAAAHLAPLVDFCDLDGNLLIADDPFEGVKGEGGILTLPDSPGLGVTPA
jgi:L-alanine-DL-glutamate epimerase-like enolase superfamily enzyme